MLVVPCPALVGRAPELDALVAALDDAAGGHGRLVLVTGEAGIGKSRLAQEVAERASARGMRLLRGRAVPGSAAPFRPLTEALAPVVPGVVQGDDLRSWLPALSALLPTVVPSAGAEATAPVRGEAVLRVLAAACSPAGGLVLLEDLHWADAETVAIVEHLGDHLGRAPVLCLATIRPEADGPAHDLLRRAEARRAPQVLPLGRLNRAQVAAMVHSCTGGADGDAVDRVLDLSDGIPFLVEEMLAAPGLPDSFAEAVAARLAALAPPVRDVLVSASASGREFDWRLLATTTGRTEAEVVDALERGVAAQLLSVEGDGFRFRHALTAEAVFRSVLPPRRAAIAGAALAALDAAHDPLPAELRDLAARLAERAGRPDRAGATLAAAGADALERGALDTAVAALDRAHRLLPAGDARDAAGERLVAALSLAGRVDAAFEVRRGLVGRLPPGRAAATHLRLADAALTASRWELASTELAAAAAGAGAEDDPALRAELAVRQAELAVGTDEPAAAEAHAAAALALARAAGVASLECEALQVRGRLARRTSLATAERWFRDALDVAVRHDLPLWRLRATHELGTIALLDRSDVTTLLEAQALAESMGAMATAAILDIEIAAGHASAHDIAAAERHGRQAAQRGRELGLDLVAAYGWHHVAGAAVVTGDTAASQAAAAASRAAAPGDRDVDGLLVGLEVLAALMADDVDRALGASERSTALLRGSATAPPAHFRAGWPLLLAVRHRPEAAAARHELDRAGLGTNRPCRGTLAMASAVLAGRTDPARAAALAVEADADLTFVPLWRHLVRRLAAQAAAEDRWTLPAAWLDETEAWCRAQGAPVVADACAALRPGGPATTPSPWAHLGVTRREADVLALVVEGCSNREIADRLHLSVRTVEKHVEALLRKTQTTSRTRLARVATTT